MNELRKRHLALPEDVWRHIKSRAAMEGLTIADYITKLIRTEIVTPVYRRGTWTADDQIDVPIRKPRPYQDLTKEAYEKKVATPDVAIDRFGTSRPAPKTRKTTK